MYKFKIGETVNPNAVKVTIKGQVFNLIGQRCVVLARSVSQVGDVIYLIRTMSTKGSHLWNAEEKHVWANFELLVEEDSLSQPQLHKTFEKGAVVFLKSRIGEYTVETLPLTNSKSAYYAFRGASGELVILPEDQIV